MDTPPNDGLQWVRTDDQSLTLYCEAFGETYHSARGAYSEARYVFVEHGARRAVRGGELRVLEYGLGMGLNFLATWEWAVYEGVRLYYVGLELHPVPFEGLPPDAVAGVNAGVQSAWRAAMGAEEWGSDMALADGVVLRKERVDFLEYRPAEGYFDAVYFDAFSPQSVPEQWSESVFAGAFRALRPGGYV